ncbi:MAG: hypothetical protein NC117_09125 [Pseudoflavonifractor sp.]|nr:hypothetical protein [Pseudoflavonifractor sp.]
MKNIWNVIFSLLLIAYLVVAVAWSRSQAAEAVCEGMRIEVNDTSSSGFVTAVEIGHELGDLNVRAKGMPLREIDTDSIERILGAVDRIEDARAVILNDRHILVEVTPMRPVARVFDGDRSYYINKDGKRISADARYHVDVPVIAGHFTDDFKAASLLPLVNYIEGDDKWRSLISMISAPDSRNIFIVPIIRGHVINLGDLDRLDDKFARIDRFYREVLPVKGWNHYDTLSVKWDGQLVATRRVKNLANPMTDVDIESENEDPDMGTMLTEGDTPTLPHDNHDINDNQ